MPCSYLVLRPRDENDWQYSSPIVGQTIRHKEVVGGTYTPGVGNLLFRVDTVGEFSLKNKICKFRIVWDNRAVKVTAQATTPISPKVGEIYIVLATAVGEWKDQENKLAEWNGVEWVYSTASSGFMGRDSISGDLYTWDGAAWNNDPNLPDDIEIYLDKVGGGGSYTQKEKIGDILTTDDYKVIEKEIFYPYDELTDTYSIRYKSVGSSGDYPTWGNIYVECGFIGGDITQTSYYYKLLSGSIRGISGTDSSIDLFKEVNTIKSVREFEGIGGVAKALQLSFSIINDKININNLYGTRVDWVAGTFDNPSFTYDIGGHEMEYGLLFKGKVYQIKRGDLLSSSVTCRSILGELDESVGESFNSENEKYKNLIYPIIYGDNTDSNAGVKLLVNRCYYNKPRFYADGKKLKSVSNIIVPDGNEIYGVKDIESFTLKDGYLEYTGSDIGMQVHSDPMTGTWPNIIIKGDCAIVDGSPDWKHAKIQEEMSSEYNYSYEEFTSRYWQTVPSKPTIIRVENELMLLVDRPYRYIDSGVCYTELSVERGYLGTVPVSHPLDSIVYLIGDTSNSLEIMFNHDFYVKALSGIHSSQKTQYGHAVGYEFWNLRKYFTRDKDTWIDDTEGYGGNQTNIADLTLGKMVVFRLIGNWSIADAYHTDILMDFIFPTISVDAEVRKMKLKGHFKFRCREWGNAEDQPEHWLKLISSGMEWVGLNNDSLINFWIIAQGFWSTGMTWENFKSHATFSGDYLIGEKNGKLVLTDSSLTDRKVNGIIGKLSELNSVRFGLDWEVNGNRNDTWLELQNIAFNIDFVINPEKVQMYAQVEGRVFDSDTTYFRGTGDGTTLIENPVEIIESFLRTECGLTNDELDSTSFGIATTARNSWKSTYILDRTKKVSEILKDICYENGLIIYETQNGKIGCSIVSDPGSNSGLTEITNSKLVLNETKMLAFKEEYTSLYNVITTLLSNYQKKTYDDSGDKYGETFSTSDDGNYDTYHNAAQLMLGREKTAVWNSQCLRDLDTLKAYSTDVMKWYYKPVRSITQDLTWDCLGLHVGQFVYFSSDSKVPGVVGHRYLITSFKPNEEEKTVTVRLAESS